MTNRRRVGVLLIAVLLAGCGSTSTPGAVPPGSGAPVTDFAQFLAGVRGARYADYAGQPGTQVRDAAQFEVLRQYLLDRYGQLTVTTSYRLGDAVVDCVPVGAAPSVPPAPVGPPDGSSTAPPAGGAAVSQGSSCPAGSVPLRRITLADLVRFTDLASFLGKDPGGGGGLPPVPSPPGG